MRHPYNLPLQKVIDDAIKAIKRSLGIASPSKLMRDEIGAMMARALALGFLLKSSA